jgi:hypothetical protein
MFKFMFRPATVSASVHVRAWPGVSTAATPLPVAGPSAKNKYWQEMFDMDNEGQQHNAGLPPAPDSSNDADNDASH